MTMTDEWYTLIEKAAMYAGRKYEVSKGTVTEWMPLAQAARASNFYIVPTRLTGDVMLEDGSVRRITDEEYNLIVEIADEWDANK